MNISTLRLRGAALLATLALTPLVDARHEVALPDTTYVAAQIRDVPALRALQETHPFALDVKKAGFDQFFAPALKKFQDEIAKADKADAAKFQKFLDALKGDLFNGEAIFAFVQTPKPEKGHDPFDFVVIVDTGADEKKLAEFVADAAPLKNSKLKKADSSSQGVTLHEFNFTADNEAPVSLGGWALVGKTFVYATAPNILRDAVDALKNNGRKDSLAHTPLWKRSNADAGKADIFLVANLPLATAELRKFVVKEAKAEEANMLAVDYVKAYDTLALDSFEAFWISSQATPTEVIAKSSISFKDRRGLLTLDTFKPLSNLVPPFIPDDKNLVWSVTRYDLTQAWKNLDVLIGQALPTLKPMLDGQITQLKAKEGIDLRDALLENFGENIITISDFGSIKELAAKEHVTTDDIAKGINRFLLIADVRDSAKLTSLIDTAVGKIGAGGAEAIFSEREFMGVKIRTIKETQKERVPTISYALHAGNLFFSFGAEKTLEKVIAEIKSPQGTLAKNETIQQALKRIPKGASSFAVYDVETYNNFIIDILTVSFRADPSKGDINNYLDSSKRPAPGSLPWSATGYTESRPNELYSEMVIFRKEGAK